MEDWRREGRQEDGEAGKKTERKIYGQGPGKCMDGGGGEQVDRKTGGQARRLRRKYRERGLEYV